MAELDGGPTGDKVAGSTPSWVGNILRLQVRPPAGLATFFHVDQR